jgi:osmotically-inducible protein OsmY
MKTDEQGQKDVTVELAGEPSINAAQIGVEVADGIATLAGHVDRYVAGPHPACVTSWTI